MAFKEGFAVRRLKSTVIEMASLRDAILYSSCLFSQPKFERTHSRGASAQKWGGRNGSAGCATVSVALPVLEYSNKQSAKRRFSGAYVSRLARTCELTEVKKASVRRLFQYFNRL